MNDDKTSPAAGVGYCRPPIGRRFRKGQSGNPAGRPKGSRNRPRRLVGEDPLGALIREEIYRLIKVNGESGEAKMPAAQVVIRSLILAAAKGDLKSQAAVLKMASDCEDRDKAQGPMSDGETQDPVAQEPHEPREIIFRIVDPAPPKQGSPGTQRFGAARTVDETFKP